MRFIPVLTLFLFLSAPPAHAALDKAAVEEIVRAYIQEHPEEIVDAVTKWQERSVTERSQAAIRANKTDIYMDLNTPHIGNPEGDVTLVEFFDYNCGYCKKVLPTMLELVAADKDLRILFKEFPILGESSELAAKWAMAAHMQGKYFSYHRALMDNKKPITESLLEKIAKDTGLDVKKARDAAHGTDVLVQIERNRTLAANMDIRGTPAFIVGETLLPGVVSLEEMKKAIAAARADKKAE